jgi:acyl carrier protein
LAPRAPQTSGAIFQNARQQSRIARALHWRVPSLTFTAVTLSNDIRTKLQNIFREVFDDEQLQLTDATSRETLESWDSLGHIRLVSAMEEELGVSFTIEEIEHMTSVPQIMAALAAK